VALQSTFFKSIIDTHAFCLDNFKIGGVYVASTLDDRTGVIEYGGSIIKKKIFRNEIHLITPADKPINCDLANANILYVCSNVVEKIGIFDTKYIHGIADYDYTLSASENKLPVLVCPGIGGICHHDHSRKYWLPSHSTIRQRIKYLYSPKGLAYKEYMYYTRKHFPLSVPYVFLTLWAKTFFPFIWERFK
jgi:GT2 family glycosyltransferase